MSTLRAVVVLCAAVIVQSVAVAQQLTDAEAAPACITPPPSDEALVRDAAEWMFPGRTIEIPAFGTGSTADEGGTAHVRQNGAGLSLVRISRSVSRPRPGEFSISGTMTLAATLVVDYRVSGIGKSCDLTVQGPFAVRADVRVDRGDPLEDRVEPLTIDQVNDSGLRFQGCPEVRGATRFDNDLRDHLSAVAVAEIFVPACRPCASAAFRACAAP